jgi:hypothetical protein
MGDGANGRGSDPVTGVLARRVAAVLALSCAASPRAGSDDFASAVTPPDPTPVLQEHRYRMSVAIRPLFFWLWSRNVGAARITWRGGQDGRRGYELLLGSDPRRAPRRINRWGWVSEHSDGRGVTMLGVMRKTEAESLEDARAQLRAELSRGFVFKAIRAHVVDGEGRAENTVLRVAGDYSYRELGELLKLVETTPRSPPQVRSAPLPEGTRPGFLFAVAEMVEMGVGAANAGGDLRPLAGRSLPFTFNAGAYDLRLREVGRLASATYGGRRYQALVRMRFESLNRELRTRERFTLVCGTEGAWARVPVFVEYQPKWWFKAEGVLDETEVF